MSRVPGKSRERLIWMAHDLNAGDGGDRLDRALVETSTDVGGDRLYRALVETSTDVIALIHLDGRVGSVNSACGEILG
jgi:PAS domain-containing protein